LSCFFGVALKETIAVLPGDGIGPEVIAEAVKVLEALDLGFEFIQCEVGSKAYNDVGTPLPPEVMDICESAKAVLFGAAGHSYAPYGIPRQVSIYLRIDRDAYANIRPLKLFPGIFGEDDPRNKLIDVTIIRDVTEGFAVEHEGDVWGDRGRDIREITLQGAMRISDYAFKYAERENRKRVTCIDCHNLLFSDKLFRTGFNKVAENYPNIETTYLSVDVASMKLTQTPEKFDVIVTPDIYGDILAGNVIGQLGGVGLAPSACIGDNFAYFEPIGGPAWDIAGKNVANPLGAILASKLMLEWMDMNDHAARIDTAVRALLEEGEVRTPDLGGTHNTSQVGDAVVGYLRNPEQVYEVEIAEIPGV